MDINDTGQATEQKTQTDNPDGSNLSTCDETAESFWQAAESLDANGWRLAGRARINSKRLAIWEAGLSPEGSLNASMDEMTREVLCASKAAFVRAGFPSSWALFAVGGTGRGEILPRSDTDLLLLRPKTEDEGFDEAKAADSSALLSSSLWDVGLMPSVSARTAAECSFSPGDDATVASAIVDRRFVAGRIGSIAELDLAVASTDKMAFLLAKTIEMEDRHRGEDGAPLSLEPSVKESPGGLRDIHTALVVAKACGFGSSWADMAKAGIVSASEAEEAEFHGARLREARAWLHVTAGRAEERLSLANQDSIAASMGLGALEGKSPAEAFMDGFHASSKAVWLLCSIAMASLREAVDPPGGEGEQLDPAFVARDGVLFLSHPDSLATNPGAILEAFLWMQRRGDLREMSAGTMRAIRRASRRFDPWFRAGAKNKGRFISILKSPRAVSDQIALMHKLGILGTYLPAFSRVDTLLQRDLFHAFTVGRHSIGTARNVRRMTCPEHAHELPLHSRVATSFDGIWRVVLAALLHDLGKGSGKPHEIVGAEIAREFCQTHGLSEADSDLVVWLVASHLEMSRVSQKEDVHDPETVSRFALFCQTRERLEALFMLTAADMRATGPNVWNPWKARLLVDLFSMTGKVLDAGPRSKRGPDDEKKAAARAIMRKNLVPEGAERALWRTLDPSYFMRHSASAMAWHAKSISLPRDAGKTLIRARTAEAAAGVAREPGIVELEVMVWTPDTPLLFSVVCSWLSRNGWSVDDAKLQLTSGSMALGTLRIHDTSERALARDLAPWVETGLAEDILSGKNPPPHKVRHAQRARSVPVEPSVSFSSDGMGKWIMEVACADRPGILWDIADETSAAGVSIVSAKISTVGALVEDVFLVSGSALGDHLARLAISRAIVERLRVR